MNLTKNRAMYCRPVEIRGKNTLKQSMENYKNYVRNRDGPPVYDNTAKQDDSLPMNKKILDLAKRGARRSKLTAMFGTSIAVQRQIAASIEYRNARRGKTDLLYLWGKSGVGKTTQIHRALVAL